MKVNIPFLSLQLNFTNFCLFNYESFCVIRHKDITITDNYRLQTQDNEIIPELGKILVTIRKNFFSTDNGG